jgi:hypothetical protein
MQTIGVPFFVALALGSASLGYFLGRGTGPPAADHKHAPEPASENPRINEDQGDSDESDAEADGDLGRIQPEPDEECKLVRSSLRTAHLFRFKSNSYPCWKYGGSRGTERS